MTDPSFPPEIFDPPSELVGLRIDPGAPLIIVDVDEVLAMFMRAFERFVGARGLEMRITRFALFQNIYRPGEAKHLDLAAGRVLFDEFFQSEVAGIEVAPGAPETLAELAEQATIVILTNAPDHSRSARARWLIDRGLPYSLVVNTGLKGPAVAALAARTGGETVFIDDLLPHLDSVEASAPAVHRFQMVADERLRPLAFCAPDRHQRIDSWPLLGEAVTGVLSLSQR